MRRRGAGPRTVPRPTVRVRADGPRAPDDRAPHHAAKFPTTKGLDSFDFKAIRSLNKMQVLELALRADRAARDRRRPWSERDRQDPVPLSETAAELLFEPISQRCERGSMLITSSLPFDEWTEVFGSRA